MELEEVRRRIDKLQEGTSSWPSQVATTDGYVYDLQTVYRAICDVTKALDELESPDGPPVDVDDGFVILPMPRYEALREAEETLQETRFEPDGDDGQDEKQATIDALKRRGNELAAANMKFARDYAELAHHAREQRAEIERLEEAAKARAEAATAGEPQLPPVLDKHLQDLQAEIDGIKDRLDEGCGQFNKIKDRLDTAHEQSAALFCSHWDRINALAARMNKLEAREVART
jgi:DNA repair exonuclease SbcCD ATPase subunit